MLTWAIFLFSAACFLFALAIFLWLGLRFGALILSMEIGILKEFGGIKGTFQPVIQQHEKTENKLKDFIKSRFAPTEGEFISQSDEEQFLQEQVEHLRNQGLNQDELDAFVRQAVGTDIGSPDVQSQDKD